MTYSLGVDLGTTSVAAAVARSTGVEMFMLGERDVVTPAVVYVREDGTIITGDAAERRAARHPDPVGRGIKRRLGDSAPIMLSDVPYFATTLLGAQLRDVVRKVVDTEGGPPERIVLTHPAGWEARRRELFAGIASAAGLEPVQLATESDAIAVHVTGRLAEGEIAAVYDLGGGAFTATVVRRLAEGYEVLGTPERIDGLGGVAFDEAILAHVDDVTGGALTALDPGDAQSSVALARLRQDCILAKEALSLDRETVIPVFLPGRHGNVELTRAVFEEMVRARLESTIDALSRAVRSAGQTPADLTSVLLVGGSSRIPLVAEMVSREFGRPTVADPNPEYAMALGAASIAAASTAPAPVAQASIAEPSVAERAGRGGVDRRSRRLRRRRPWSASVVGGVDRGGVDRGGAGCGRYWCRSGRRPSGPRHDRGRPSSSSPGYPSRRSSPRARSVPGPCRRPRLRRRADRAAPVRAGPAGRGRPGSAPAHPPRPPAARGGGRGGRAGPRPRLRAGPRHRRGRARRAGRTAAAGPGGSGRGAARAAGRPADHQRRAADGGRHVRCRDRSPGRSRDAGRHARLRRRLRHQDGLGGRPRDQRRRRGHPDRGGPALQHRPHPGREPRLRHRLRRRRPDR